MMRRILLLQEHLNESDEPILTPLLECALPTAALVVRGAAEPSTPLSCSDPALAPQQLALITHGLSPRECEVVLLDFMGLSRIEIAQQLHLAPSTIKTYWKRIYAKLGIHQRSVLRQWLRGGGTAALNTTLAVHHRDACLR